MFHSEWFGVKWFILKKQSLTCSQRVWNHKAEEFNALFLKTGV